MQASQASPRLLATIGAVTGAVLKRTALRDDAHRDQVVDRLAISQDHAGNTYDLYRAQLLVAHRAEAHRAFQPFQICVGTQLVLEFLDSKFINSLEGLNRQIPRQLSLQHRHVGALQSELGAFRPGCRHVDRLELKGTGSALCVGLDPELISDAEVGNHVRKYNAFDSPDLGV